MPSLERLVFAGTPAFSAACLEALLDAGFAVNAVYTQPDRPAGRGKKLQASPVKQLALQHGLPVRQPSHFRDTAACAELAASRPDLLIVVAYGLLLPQAVLDIPRLGCINVHASLLPRWRGAAPIERAIEAGDTETGITLMQMNAGLDTGPMLLKNRLPIRPDDTGADLRQRLALLGAQTLVDGLHALTRGVLQAEAQNEAAACYAHKLERAEAAIDWQQPAVLLARRIRAFNDANPCWTLLGEQRLKLWRAVADDHDSLQPPGTVIDASATGIRVACGTGSLCLTELQLPGARALPVRAVLNGHAALFAPGTVLGGSGA